MENERLYSVLKCNNMDYDLYIFSTTLINSVDETHKYYYLTLEDGLPKIIDINNPIETLKSLDTKPINIQNNQQELIRFLAYKELAENNIIKKMS